MFSMDDSVSHPGCPACGSGAFGWFLSLTIRPITGMSLDPAVDVALRCPECRHRELVGDSVRIGSLRRLDLLREVLALETGMSVFVDPPDDPPAGVREPRRPPPGGGTFASQLELPRD